MNAKESETQSSPEPSSPSTTTTTTCSAKNLMELPRELHYQILSRVNSGTLFSCRAVCKVFLDILSTEYFLQLSNSTETTILLLQGKDSPDLYFLFRRNGFRLEPLTVKELYFPDQGYNTRRLINCIDGIVCLCHDILKKPAYAIWNLALRQFISLPRLQELDKECTYLGYSAFGSCRRKEKHKIIRFELYDGKPVIRVLTIGTGSWRLIEEGVKAPKPESTFDPLVNGALHWITADGSDDLIYSFDVEKEILKPIPPPPNFDVKKVSWVSLASHSGALLLWVQENNKYEAWIMRKYGVKESWTRENFDFADDNPHCFDVVKQHIVVPYKPSFVSLQDVIKEKQFPVEVQTYVSRGGN